ncbi:hypothetical protein BLOT_007981 [Blomia tropicalis]|nr:hypothetical protein BLOT_007981 [Blomia tropicalis]
MAAINNFIDFIIIPCVNYIIVKTANTTCCTTKDQMLNRQNVDMIRKHYSSIGQYGTKLQKTHQPNPLNAFQDVHLIKIKLEF